MRTENDAVASGKKPRKLTVTVVVGPQTLAQITLLAAAQEALSPVAREWSVSDVIGAAVNLGLSEMGRVLLGGAKPADGCTHSTPHSEGYPCEIGCVGYRTNHYA